MSEQALSCVWCGRKFPKSPEVFRAPGPLGCGQPDCEQAQQAARHEFALGERVLTQKEAGAVQRFVRCSLELPEPMPEEMPSEEWFEGFLETERASSTDPKVVAVTSERWREADRIARLVGEAGLAAVTDAQPALKEALAEYLKWRDGDAPSAPEAPGGCEWRTQADRGRRVCGKRPAAMLRDGGTTYFCVDHARRLDPYDPASHAAKPKRKRNRNRVGCRLTGDVCAEHDLPKFCPHGCWRATAHDCTEPA